MMGSAPRLDRRAVLAIFLTTVAGMAVSVSLVPRLMRTPSVRGWDVALVVVGVACAAMISRRRLIPLMIRGDRRGASRWIYGLTASLMFASLGLTCAVLRLLS